MNVTVVLPRVESDGVSYALRRLTAALEAQGHRGGYGLGGEHGYGVDVETDEFVMHRHCWCDSDTCPWCEDEAPNFHHKPTGLMVWWYKYIGRGMEVIAPDGVDPVAVIMDLAKRNEGTDGD